jgi:uncharacterized protein YegJ (DUF2314 family)
MAALWETAVWYRMLTVNSFIKLRLDLQEDKSPVIVKGEDHVWFEDRWIVASLCDEWLTTLCGLILG